MAFSVVTLLGEGGGGYFEDSHIIVHNHDVCLGIVLEQVGGYLLPWSLWQRSWYHGICMVLSVFATGRASCDHVFSLFAETRPPYWIMDYFATFADSLVTCMDFIQYIQAKGWGNVKSWVFPEETSLEHNRSSFWPKGNKCWVQLWVVRPSFSTELLQFSPHVIILLVKTYLI